jgi:putative transcriptional regulator
LSEGFSLVLAAHLETCSQCRVRKAEAEALGGELLNELPSAEMASADMSDFWDRLETTPPVEPPAMTRHSRHEGLPAVLTPYLEGGMESISWRSLVPGIRQHVLEGIDSGNGSVRLLSIAPGTTIPHHTHGGSELTLVLEGSYSDEIGPFQSGDLADLDSSVHHQPVADSDGPCICLIATDERLQFSGAFSRMLQPFVGI